MATSIPVGTQIEKSALPALAKIPIPGALAAIWTRGKVRWASMLPPQRTAVVVAGTLLMFLAGGLAWYALRTDWRILCADLDPGDARQMEQILNQSQITYDVDAKGRIRVPASQLDKARLATAAKGGLKSGRMGFEIFDKPNWVGSEFDEQVNYQRALEGELEHTVSTLADVESARVHLVLPHDSLFRDQDRPAKASVVLQLRHRALADGEPEAIRNLVGSAVDGLAPERVVLVDAAGHLPLGPKTAEALQLSAEQVLEEKLIATLEPVTGPGNVRASVNLDYDRTATDETEEKYDPNQTVALTMQRSEQSSGPQALAAGIPGSASNAPNAQSLPVYPQLNSPPQSAKSESGTYGVSKTVRHTVENPGRIRRMTAAIVVNDRLVQSPNRGHAPVWQPRSGDELRNLTALAQAAVGFSSARGDALTVEDLTFDENLSLRSSSLFSRILEEVEGSPVVVKCAAFLLGIGLVLVFGIRPALRRPKPVIVRAAKSTKQLSNETVAAQAEATSHASTLPPPEPPPLDAETVRQQEILEQVSDHLKREPAQSSRLLQSWIQSE